MDGPFSVRVGEAMESVWVPLPPPRLRLFTVAATSSVTVKVVLAPFAPMTTSSPAAGSWAGLQFAALLQFPVPAFQLMVSAGASRASENSDVLPFASVAVAVTLSLEWIPCGRRSRKPALPSAPVVTSAEARSRSPSDPGRCSRRGSAIRRVERVGCGLVAKISIR